jgi:hypothetical protein
MTAQKKARNRPASHVNNVWTEDEERFLRANYMAMASAELAAKMGRTVASVKMRRIYLGLPPRPRPAPRGTDPARAALAKRKYKKSAKGQAKRAAYQKSWWKTAKGRAAALTHAARHRRANPGKVAARTALQHAVRDGRIVRGPCEVCGNANTHGHHDDYSKPLDVRWLCRKHHDEWHANNQAKNARRSA